MKSAESVSRDVPRDDVVQVQKTCSEEPGWSSVISGGACVDCFSFQSIPKTSNGLFFFLNFDLLIWSCGSKFRMYKK